MDVIQKSGYYDPNKFARLTLEAFEQVMGKHEGNSLLGTARLDHLLHKYPANNLEREFDFAEFTSINLALEELYGSDGRGLAHLVGSTIFGDALPIFGPLSGVNRTTVSDQHTTVTSTQNEVINTIHRCPICWGRQNEDQPVCHIAVGLLQEGLKWVSNGREFDVFETKYLAAGDNVCEFIIQKIPIH